MGISQPYRNVGKNKGGNARSHLGPQRKAFKGRGSNVMPAYMKGQRVGQSFSNSVKPGLLNRVKKTSNFGTETAAKNYLSGASRTNKGPSKKGAAVAAVAVGAAAAGYGGYKAYQHRDDIKTNAQRVSNHFHASRLYHGGGG